MIQSLTKMTLQTLTKAFFNNDKTGFKLILNQVSIWPTPHIPPEDRVSLTEPAMKHITAEYFQKSLDSGIFLWPLKHESSKLKTLSQCKILASIWYFQEGRQLPFLNTRNTHNLYPNQMNIKNQAVLHSVWKHTSNQRHPICLPLHW